MNLQNHISVNKPIKGILDKYIDSSILAMTSTYEGLPMVLLEAMSCGIPVISYGYKCGPKDIITNGEDGFCLDENDEDEYVSKLLLMMEDINLRKTMGEKARQKSRSFSSDTIMQKWIALFQSLLQKPSHHVRIILAPNEAQKIICSLLLFM